MRDSFVLTSLFVIAACPPPTGTTTAEPGTTDDPTASTGEPTTGTTGTTGTTDDPTGTTDDPSTGTTGDPTTGTTNTPPTAPVVAITPASPTRLDDLTCAVTTESTDADGDPVSYTFSWTRDGADAGVASMTVPAAEIEVGEAWACTAVPSDGTDEGPSGTAEATILPVCTSLEFDGVDDHIGAAHISAGTWTLEAWVLPGAPAGQQAIISQVDPATDPFLNFELGLEGGVPYVLAPDGTTWLKAGWDAPITPGEWHHVAGMYDGANVSIAVDGVIGQVVPSVFAESDIPLMIGTRLNNDFYFEGTIFEARVSSTARYAAPFDPPVGFAPDADTLGLWRLDEGQGATCVDSSTSANDGAVTGDAAWATMTCPDSGANGLAETCADIKAADPGAVDGDYTLYIGKDANKPWTAYCHDMAGTPKEYLSLVNTEEGRNYSMYKANDPGETDVVTRFTRVRLDPLTLIVDIDDLTFSTSMGMVDHGGPVTSMPYAVAEGCAAGNLADGTANIDLVGTPFKVIDPFCTTGAAAAGEATFSAGDQVVDLTGGGFCGWTGPTKGDMCVSNPQSKNSGFVLDLEYIGAPQPIAETCAEIKANDPGAADGEYTLHVGKDENKPWTAYCHDMDGSPKDYLPLVNVQDGRNFSMYSANDPGETDVVTRFTRVRLDPLTLIVDIDDLTFSTSMGMVDHGGPVTSMPYAVAQGCTGGNIADGLGNVDLVGTPFKVIDPFCTTGLGAAGEAVFSQNDQVVDLTGGGFCGWTGPTNGGMCVDNPQNKSSGFVLDLEYIDGQQQPIFETCADVKANDPGAPDGEYKLHVAKDENKPWTAYCHDMAGTPKEYLPLVNVQDGRNFSMYAANDPGETDVVTTFTRVRLDPLTLSVDIDDLTFSSSTGMVVHGGPVTSMPYAVAEGCAGPDVADGVANIDLVGTPFKVIDPFCTTGAAAAGEAVLSQNDQVVDLTGGGLCGWTGPTNGGMCVDNPQNKNNGFVLDLAYASP